MFNASHFIYARGSVKSLFTTNPNIHYFSNFAKILMKLEIEIISIDFSYNNSQLELFLLTGNKNSLT